jgi:hypothetical protein
MHFSADLVCSGGFKFDIWIRLIWSFVFQHVHLTSLRMFLVLQEKTVAFEGLIIFRSPEFQKRISDVVVHVVQTLPRQYN